MHPTTAEIAGSADGTLYGRIVGSDAASITILGRGDDTTTHGADEVLSRAEELGRELVSRGVAPGDVVAVAVTTDRDTIAACVAVWMAGGILAPIAPPAPLESRTTWRASTASILARLRARACVSRGVIEEMPDVAWVDPSATARSTAALPTAPSGRDVAIVKLTSGTTGEPRAIARTHAALLASLESRALGEVALDPAHDVRLGWGPLHGRALNSDLLYPLGAGVPTVLLPSRRFSEDPVRWLVEMSRHRATFSSAPNFAYATVARRLEGRDELSLDLSHWRFAQCAGEVADPAALRAFAHATARFGFDPGALVVSYGSTEAAGVTDAPVGRGIGVDHVDPVALAAGRAVAVRESPGSIGIVSVGRPCPGGEVRILGPDGEACPERVVGDVFVRNPWMMQGYLDDPEATARRFTADGWLSMGDRGYLADGELHVIGRSDAMVIVNGRNVSVDAVEHRILAGTDGAVTAVAAIGVRTSGSQALVVVAETTRGTSELRTDIERSVWNAVGVALHDVWFVAPDALPRNDSGKLDRARVRGRYEARAER